MAQAPSEIPICVGILTLILERFQDPDMRVVFFGFSRLWLSKIGLFDYLAERSFLVIFAIQMVQLLLLLQVVLVTQKTSIVPKSSMVFEMLIQTIYRKESHITFIAYFGSNIIVFVWSELSPQMHIQVVSEGRRYVFKKCLVFYKVTLHLLTHEPVIALPAIEPWN